MKLKNLRYNATHSFTGQEIGDAGAPEMVYGCRAYRADGWTDKVIAFFEGEGQDTDLALDVVGLSLVWIEQDGERYPITDRDGAVALQEAIEEQNPGYGGIFIRRLAVAVYDQQSKFENERLGNSVRRSEPSDDGKTDERSLSATSAE